MSVGPNSRNRYCVVVRRVSAFGQVEPDHLDIRPQLTRIFHADNQEYYANGSDNWSKIAWKLLGDGRFYWVIADYSGVVDPFVDLATKTVVTPMTQLTVSLVINTTISFITVANARRFQRGTIIRIEDLNPSNLCSYDVGIIKADTTTGIIQLGSPLTPSTAVAASTSRVSIVTQQRPRLTVPTPHRLLFEVLDFHNPLNTLVL